MVTTASGRKRGAALRVALGECVKAVFPGHRFNSAASVVRQNDLIALGDNFIPHEIKFSILDPVQLAD
jgi:hypothetical protein